MGPIGGLKPALPPLKKLSPLGIPGTGPQSNGNPLQKSILGSLDKSKQNGVPLPQKNKMSALKNKMVDQGEKMAGNFPKSRSLSLKANTDFRKKPSESSEENSSESDNLLKQIKSKYRFVSSYLKDKKRISYLNFLK